MSSNQHVMQRYVAAFNAGDLNAFNAIIDPDYVNHDPLRPHLDRGLASLKTVVAEMRAMFPDLRFEHVAFVEDGDLLASHLLLHGVAAQPVRQIQIERFSNGRIVEHWRATGSGN